MIQWSWVWAGPSGDCGIIEIALNMVKSSLSKGLNVFQKLNTLLCGCSMAMVWSMKTLLSVNPELWFSKLMVGEHRVSNSSAYNYLHTVFTYQIAQHLRKNQATNSMKIIKNSCLMSWEILFVLLTQSMNADTLNHRCQFSWDALRGQQVSLSCDRILSVNCDSWN